jgi:hypothetical protein
MVPKFWQRYSGGAAQVFYELHARSGGSGGAMKNAAYVWEHTLVVAIREIDPDKVTARLRDADDAVFNRLLEIEGSNDDDEERSALEDAMDAIRLLRSHPFRLTF